MEILCKYSKKILLGRSAGNALFLHLSTVIVIITLHSCTNCSNPQKNLKYLKICIKLSADSILSVQMIADFTGHKCKQILFLSHLLTYSKTKQVNDNFFKFEFSPNKNSPQK